MVNVLDEAAVETGESAGARAGVVVNSLFLAGLDEGGDTVPGVRRTVVATRCDEVVTPPAVSV